MDQITEGTTILLLTLVIAAYFASRLVRSYIDEQIAFRLLEIRIKNSSDQGELDEIKQFILKGMDNERVSEFASFISEEIEKSKNGKSEFSVENLEKIKADISTELDSRNSMWHSKESISQSSSSSQHDQGSSVLDHFGKFMISCLSDEALVEFREETKQDIKNIGPDTPEDDIGGMHSLLADIEAELAKRRL